MAEKNIKRNIACKRITCYTDNEEYPVCSDEYIGIRPIYEETIGWYSNDNTYYSECKISYMNKEELIEYLKKFEK